MPRTVKKPAAKPVTIPPAGNKSPVTRRVAKRGHTPVVTKPPRGSKERKVVEQTTEVPYWQEVKRKFFR